MPKRRTALWYRLAGILCSLAAAFYWVAEIVDPRPFHLALAIMFTCVAAVYLFVAKRLATRAEPPEEYGE